MNKKFSTLVAALLVSGGSFVVASQYMGSPLMSSPLAMAAAANLRATGAVAENYSIEAAKAESFDAAKIWTAAAANGGITFATANGSVLYKSANEIKLAKKDTQPAAVFTVDAEGKLKVGDLFVLISNSGLSLAETADGGKCVSAYSAEGAVAVAAAPGAYALAEDTRDITGVSSVKLNTTVSNPVFAASDSQESFEGATQVSIVKVVDWYALKIANNEYLSVDAEGNVNAVSALDRNTCEVSVSNEGYISVAGKKLYLNITDGVLTAEETDGVAVYLATEGFDANMSEKVLKGNVSEQQNQSLFAVTDGSIGEITGVSVFKYTASATTNTFVINNGADFDGAVKATYTAEGKTLAVGGKLIKSTEGTVTAEEEGTAISLDNDGAIKIETDKFLVIDGEGLKSVATVNTESKLYLYKNGEKVTTLAAEGAAQYVIANVQYGSQFTTNILTVTATEQDLVEAAPGAEIPGMGNVTTDAAGKITGLTSGDDIVAPFTISPNNDVYLAVSGNKVVKLSGDDAKDIEKNLNAAWVMEDGMIVSVAKALAGADKKYLKVAGNVLKATTTTLTDVTLVAEASASEATVAAGGTLSIGAAEAGTMTLSEAALPAITFEESGDQPLIKGAAGSGPYLLSAANGKYIKGADASEDPSDPYAMWKVESQTLSDGTVFYSFYRMDGTTKTYLTIEDETSFMSVNNLKYNSGLALMVGDQYLKVNANGGLELGNTYSVIGFFQVGENAIEADDLLNKRETGFDMTIAVSDAEDASTTIQGNPFTGILTPRKLNAGTLTNAGDGDETFYLMNADGDYIVQNLSATWSGSTEWMLNGDNLFDRGYKFTTVSAKDFKEKVLAAENAGKFNYAFKVSCSAAETAANASEIFVDVMDGNSENVFGRLYVAEMLNGSAVSYLLTSTDGLVEDSKEHYPYITFGGTSLLSMKEFLTTPQFYTVAEVDKNGNILSVLGATAGDAAWYEKGAIQQDQPEGQFAAKKGATDAELVLSNRENPSSTETLSSLYKTDKADIYKKGNTYYEIKAVAKHSANDGYEVWSNKQVRDEQYTLGFYSNVLGAAAYMSENHSNNHVIGLEKDIKDATSWKLKAYETSKAENGTRTDSIYVISELNFWNKNKKGGADWDAKKDTLKVVAYSLTNTANDEVFGLVDGLYISDPKWAINGVPRFAIKKKADGKYNLVKVEADADAANYKFGAKKLYGGFSIAQGVVKEIGKYTLTENDLVVLDKVAAPEYVKLNMGDTIRIFREGAEASQLFEKGEFLGMENVFEFTKMAPAMYVDTAYYNRPDNNRWEYLLVVEPKQVTSETSCSDPTHGVHKADTVFGRFLVNLVDSAEVNKNLHNNKYINTEKYAKLGFVKGFHTNDTLVIQRAGAEKAAKADSLFLGSKDPSFAKFAFRVVDNETGAFKIETAFRPYGDVDEDLTKGYLKWMNGVVVVIDKAENADIFNLKATDENPTANEAIAAEGVQVIGGKGAVTVQGAAGKVITVADILGRTIANQVAASDNVTIAAPAGIVVVAVEGEATKVVVK